MPTTLGNGNVTFGSGSAQSTAGSLLGVGQTPGGQSRSLGTTYSNGSGKPIWVSVSWTSPIGGAVGNFYVNGILAMYSVQDLYPRLQMMAVVPAGATYYCTGPGNFAYWIETR
jgi:hypothetical protein